MDERVDLRGSERGDGWRRSARDGASGLGDGISVSNELESPDDLEAGTFVTSVIEAPGGDTLGADTKGAKVVKLRTGAITVVDVPEAGEWKVTLAGDGRAGVVVTGESELCSPSRERRSRRENRSRARLGEDVRSAKVGLLTLRRVAGTRRGSEQVRRH